MPPSEGAQWRSGLAAIVDRPRTAREIASGRSFLQNACRDWVSTSIDVSCCEGENSKIFVACGALQKVKLLLGSQPDLRVTQGWFLTRALSTVTVRLYYATLSVQGSLALFLSCS